MQKNKTASTQSAKGLRTDILIHMSFREVPENSRVGMHVWSSLYLGVDGNST